MIQYLVAGLVLGAVYAISASTIAVTYQSSGVLNFAFGALAYLIARLYYFLHVQHGWDIPVAAVVAIAVAGPMLGFFLWAVLFRSLRLAPPLVKVVATIGLSVAIPALCSILFGNAAILSAPGLSPTPVRVFHVLGTAVSLDQLFVLGFVALLSVGGFLVFRFTDVGLRVKAMVDSEAMMALSGSSPGIVSAGVWMATTTLAGLVGVLVAPVIGLDPTDYTVLVVSAFAAVVVARLSNVAVAGLTGIVLGLANGVADRYLPASSSLTPAITSSIPLAAMVIALVYFQWRDKQFSSVTAGALDRAIRPAATSAVPGGAARAGEPAAGSRATAGRRTPAQVDRTRRTVGTGVVMAIVLLLPVLLGGLWVGVVADGVCFGIAFLSYTLVAGEGGMIWLCEITFAALGAGFSAHLVSVDHWPVLVAIVASAVAVVPIGLLIGVITVRMGDLYVALLTLSFGFLVDTLVLTRNVFDNEGGGVAITRPGFIVSNRAFAYFAIAIFVVLALFVTNLRRSTSGLGFHGIRSSETASRTMGLPIVWMKVLLAGFAAFVAAIGGGLLAMYAGVSLPAAYATLGGLVWLAVVVTLGVRSTIGALIAGLSFTILPTVFQIYLPASIASVPTVLFGLGAIMVARNPEGVVAVYAKQLLVVVSKVLDGRTRMLPSLRPGGATGSRSTMAAEHLAATPRAIAADEQDAASDAAIAPATPPTDAGTVLKESKVR